MKSITFFLCPTMLSTSVTLPVEQLKAAESMAKLNNKSELDQSKQLDIQFASIDGNPVETHAGITLAASAALGDISESDITYLPALWRNPRPQLAKNEALYPWLKAQHEKGKVIAGVGTGCCFMAEAGLLNQQPATTHWHYFDQFEKSYPQVDLKRKHFITQASNLFCTGSINALADLTVYFIQQHFNTHIASQVERNFFHEIRQTYLQANFLNSAIFSHHDELIMEAQYYIQENAQKEIKISAIADKLDISLRSLNRRFKNATNQTPLEFLQQTRIYRARDLLQASNLSVSEVAFQSGYSDTAHFSALFKKLLGISPKQYQVTVRGKLFTASKY